MTVRLEKSWNFMIFSKNPGKMIWSLPVYGLEQCSSLSIADKRVERILLWDVVKKVIFRSNETVQGCKFWFKKLEDTFRKEREIAGILWVGNPKTRATVLGTFVVLLSFLALKYRTYNPDIFQNKGLYSGFPPIREIREFRENFEVFFQSGKSGKNRGFSAKIREKIFKSGNFFPNHFQTFQTQKSEEKVFFKTVKPQELSGNCT